MENCLFEKLKAATNNPNLPVLEIMQQFTLDAITASGNNSMTDAQKWALNHFFYQIGAIDNTSIYSKLSILGLSFIGGNKNGALKNYASESITPSSISNDVTFASGGFTASSDNNNICTYAKYVSDDAFLFALGNNAKFQVPALRGSTNTTCNFEITTDSKITLTSNPYVTYSKWCEASAITGFTPIGASLNIASGSSAKCYAFSSEELIEMPVTYNSSEDCNIQRFIPRAKIVSNAPFAFALGKNVTTDEQIKFMTAMKELVTAFVQNN